MVAKRERRRWRGGAVLFALIGRRHVVEALLFAGESVVGVVVLFVCAAHAEA